MRSPLTQLFTLALTLLCSHSLHAEPIFALLNNEAGVGQRLVTIDSNTRAVTSNVLLQTATTVSPLTSIDVRPATGELFGYDAGARQLFTINPTTGALTSVGASLPSGSAIGGNIDFNPTVDLIRLVGAGDENLRVSPANGTIFNTDGSVAFSTGDSNEGDNPDIGGLGYTNSVAGASATMLYGIDVTNNVLVTQNPANAGTLQTVGTGLGIDLTPGALGNFYDFDISGAMGIAYLSTGQFAGESNLYSVNLGTGDAVLLGAITNLPTGQTIQSIAVAFPTATAPEPGSFALIILGAAAMSGLYRRKKASTC